MSDSMQKVEKLPGRDRISFEPCASKLAHDAKTTLTGLKLKLQLIKRLLSEPGSDAISYERLRKIFGDADRELDRFTGFIDEWMGKP